jgi:hypothetical protein
MEVVQYEVVFSPGRGFFIAAYDEEFFPSFAQAASALFNGTWTPA